MLDSNEGVFGEGRSILLAPHYLAFIDAKQLNLGLVRPYDAVPEVLLVEVLLGEPQTSLDVPWVKQ